MVNDTELKITLNNIVLSVINRMESTSDDKNRECLYQEYKEWLGTSIDDWVLALPNDWGQ